MRFEEESDFAFFQEVDEFVEQSLIEDIHEYIDNYIKEDENGEPPDDDTVIEGMGFSDDKADLVSRAYELYWKRKR